MERFQELREISKSKIQLADHMLTTTYPLVKDARLLLVVLENIFLGMSSAMSSVLYYERVFKRIPPFPENFAAKLDMFRDKVQGRYNVDESYLSLIQTIKELILLHKQSPVEFVKQDRLVICSENYSIKTVTPEQIKNYLSKAKLFIQEASSIVSKNEGIFN